MQGLTLLATIVDEISYDAKFVSHWSVKSWSGSPGQNVVLRFYGPVNPMGSCRARSVYLTTRLLGRLSPPSG